MRTSGGVPSSPGGVQTTFAATASWPSRKTVAVIGMCSPTTARAEKPPHDTTGATSEMPRRRSGRPVIAVHAIEVTPHQHLGDRKSTRLNSSHSQISYAVFCLKKKNSIDQTH